MEGYDEHKYAVEAETYRLEREYGLIVKGDNLARLLGYPSSQALKMSVRRGTCPIAVAKADGRGGYIATAYDVAEWVVNIRFSAKSQSEPKNVSSV